MRCDVVCNSLQPCERERKKNVTHEVTNDEHIAVVDCSLKPGYMGSFHDASAFTQNI